MTRATSKLYVRGRARRCWLCVVTFAAALALAGACKKGGRSGSDTTAAAAGEAGTIEVEALNYRVTPERYRQWVAAQRALDATPNLPEPPRLDPTRFNERDIARAAQYL